MPATAFPVEVPSTATIADEYLRNLSDLMTHIDLAAVDRIVTRLRSTRERGGTVYILGNGGSAATASHWATDLGKATRRNGSRPLRAVCLSDSTPWLTALANDEGYERVFAGQLENLGLPGDLVVVISASGSSPNVVSAIEAAERIGIATVALLGFDGGVLRGRADDEVWLATEPGAYGLVETGHVLVADIITACLVAG